MSKVAIKLKPEKRSWDIFVITTKGTIFLVYEEFIQVGKH